MYEYLGHRVECLMGAEVRCTVLFRLPSKGKKKGQRTREGDCDGFEWGVLVFVWMKLESTKRGRGGSCTLEVGRGMFRTCVSGGGLDSCK